MRSPIKYVLTSSVIIIMITALFLLPIIPVKVDPLCKPCAGQLYHVVPGYSSVALYFSDYGAIQVNDPDGPFYCVVYGSGLQTSCPIAVGELWKD
jgi:hypothetical protein